MGVASIAMRLKAFVATVFTSNTYFPLRQGVPTQTRIALWPAPPAIWRNPIFSLFETL